MSRGVMKMAPSVEAVVIRTDSATSPCAMYVATLEACMQVISHLPGLMDIMALPAMVRLSMPSQELPAVGISFGPSHCPQPGP